RFGHNHVVTGPVSGEIRAGESAAESGFRLDVKVASLNVDQASARGEEGSEFAAEVSPQARRGTRANMLGQQVLDAQRYPEIRIESVALSGPRWNPTVVARTTLHGVTRDLRFSAAVVEDGRRLTVVASFTIRQSDFGITPFAALGGGLRVRDAIDIRIRIVARRESGKGSS
ncbi:MAG: YceI family protein, partial [Burkholderiales bacterium]